MRIRSKNIAFLGAIAAITGCLLDLFGVFVLGSHVPGYDPIHKSMSQLGLASGPLGMAINGCWIGMGILLILFGLSLPYAFPSKKRTAWLASWLVILYGLGEGLGSGIIPVDKAGAPHTWIGLAHNLISGLGIAALAILPLITQNLLPKLKAYSVTVFVIGLFGLILFKLPDLKFDLPKFIASSGGLWQRMYLVNYYVYVIAVASILLKHSSSGKFD